MIELIRNNTDLKDYFIGVDKSDKTDRTSCSYFTFNNEKKHWIVNRFEEIARKTPIELETIQDCSNRLQFIPNKYSLLKRVKAKISRLIKLSNVNKD